LIMRVNLNTIHFLGSDVLHAKKQKYPHNLSMGTGGTWAAISRPEAVATTTWTVNPCGLANPCRSLGSPNYMFTYLFTCFAHTAFPHASVQS